MRVADEEKLTYANAIDELEGIVSEIEKGNVDVDVLASKVKRATELIRFCRARLKGTEEEVNKVFSEMEERKDE